MNTIKKVSHFGFDVSKALLFIMIVHNGCYASDKLDVSKDEIVQYRVKKLENSSRYDFEYRSLDHLPNAIHQESDSDKMFALIEKAPSNLGNHQRAMLYRASVSGSGDACDTKQGDEKGLDVKGVVDTPEAVDAAEHCTWFCFQCCFSSQKQVGVEK